MGIDPDAIPAGWGYVPSAYRARARAPVVKARRQCAPRGTVDVLVREIMAAPWLPMAVTTQDVMRKWGLAKSQAQYVVKRARRMFRKTEVPQ